ncbi:MAG: glutathione S-transferase N-terminal domain-containing protein [Bdellovibrionota bacterium]
MIKLYTWPTPNGYKVAIFLRESQTSYEAIGVNISKGEQFQPEFLKLNPNNKIPALFDDAPSFGKASVALFESGCILEYLADKTGRFLAPLGTPERYETLQWLYWQMAGLGPMLGQNHHFSSYAPEKIPYAIDRYLNETKRLYTVLDHRLESSPYVSGKDYGIADMATYPWIVSHDKQGQKLEDYPHLKKWFDAIQTRPAVQAAYAEGSRLRGENGATVSDSSPQEKLKKTNPGKALSLFPGASCSDAHAER